MQMFKAERIVIHPSFDWTAVHNDIALVKLGKDVKWSEFVQPICLPAAGSRETFADRMAIAAGWGDTRMEDGSFDASPILQKVELLQ